MLDRRLYREYAPYTYEYPLVLDLRKSYLLLIKRHDNFTAPLELVSDNIDDNIPKFEEWYKNYSSFTQPLRQWNQKVRNFMIESERKAIVMFSRFKIRREKAFQVRFVNWTKKYFDKVRLGDHSTE